MRKHLLGEPARLHRKIVTGYDTANRPVWDFEAQTLPNCVFAPSGGSGANLEPLEAGHATVIQPAKAYFMQAVEITPGDRLEIRNQVFEVIGEPEVWLSPFTGDHTATVVNLQRVTQGA